VVGGLCHASAGPAGRLILVYYYVDHTSQFERNTGIQRCVRAIARALIGEGAALMPVVWDRQQDDLVPASTEALHHLAAWSGPSADAWAPAQGGHDWLLIVELVSGPFLPSSSQLRAAADRRGLKVAWVFHDAIPLRLAHFYGSRAESTANHHRIYMEGMARFEKVLANSQTTASHLSQFLQEQGLPNHHVRALPLATEFPGLPRGEPPQMPAAGEPLRLLCVGSLEPRKNHAGLLKAVAWLFAQQRWQAELVLVGWANDPRVVALVQRVQAKGVPVRWEHDADDARLATLYRWCHVTVYPSLEEGFGLPVAESLWHRRPCVCSGLGALGELSGGGGCLPLDTSQWRAIAAGLAQLLEDPILQRRLAREVASRELRSWSAYAQELLAELKQI